MNEQHDDHVLTYYIVKDMIDSLGPTVFAVDVDADWVRGWALEIIEAYENRDE